jgi:diketogulonate reductase-like aldo/keto reductase
MVDHLTALLDRSTVVPAVNQIEVHSYFAQREVQAFGAQHGILTQAWSPIGGITLHRDGSHGSTLEDPDIGRIAGALGKPASQVMLRWHLQQGGSAIPKSTRSQRIAENFNVFDFELTGEEIAAIDSLDTVSVVARTFCDHAGDLREAHPGSVNPRSATRRRPSRGRRSVLGYPLAGANS